MILMEVERAIRELGLKGNIFKPHKLIALLTAFKLVGKENLFDGRIYFNSSFKDIFEDLFNKFSIDPSNRCRAHTPFFHLRTFRYWTLVPINGKDRDLNTTETVGGPGALCELVDHALILDPLLEILKNESIREELVHLVISCLQEGNNRARHSNQSIEMCSDMTSKKNQNPFVNYLNSFQRSGGSNENALAESQACNVHFSSIHVAHPLADVIQAELSTSNGRHVILTGHAGDGKSTLALEVYKRLSGLGADKPLDSPLHTRENVGAISVIKDLSERDKRDDETLIDELMSNEQRFLLVSNTGTLLDLIKQHHAKFQEDSVNLESQVLDAISSDSGEGTLKLGTQVFRVFNLARMDNLSLARRIFEKMLAPELWKVCAGCDHNRTCPIYTNVSLIQNHQTRVLDRIFLAFRRMYEYGTRLTMRQFTEHLAYMITSGIDEGEIPALQQRNPQRLVLEFSFFNRFFGDNGFEPELYAFEMKAVQEIRRHGFGERPCPMWEHRLWLRNSSESFTLGYDMLDDEFDKMRQIGSRETRIEGVTPDQAREQVRRMLFFFFDFRQDESNYLKQYLNSPTILDWESWQNPRAQLGFNEKTILERKIYHVLQEHFTGVRLPEGSMQNDRRLYITLSRRRSEVRQSAQVVLSQVDWSSSTSLKLVATENATGELRQDLVLCGRGSIDGINLIMKVPFLDYVMMRHFGEFGEVLKTSYLERLDRFKAQIHSRTSTSKENRIMLVRLKTDHTFRRQHFSVNGDILEVSDVL